MGKSEICELHFKGKQVQSAQTASWRVRGAVSSQRMKPPVCAALVRASVQLPLLLCCLCCLRVFNKWTLLTADWEAASTISQRPRSCSWVCSRLTNCSAHSSLRLPMSTPPAAAPTKPSRRPSTGAGLADKDAGRGLGSSQGGRQPSSVPVGWGTLAGTWDSRMGSGAK